MPFTAEQFFGVFAAYNAAIWPAQLALALLAFGVAAAAALGGRTRSRIVVVTLAGLWIWTGLVYHVRFFAEVNPAANLFGALFVAQGLLFLHAASQNSITFRFRPGPPGWLGAVLALYALVIYPLVGRSLGHLYPAAPTFGAPCPVTIFTLAILLWTDKPPPPLRLLAVPVAWSFIGGSAVLAFGMVEDAMMVLAGIGVLMLTVRARSHDRARAGWRGQGA
jgi:hypothetical protein